MQHDNVFLYTHFHDASGDCVGYVVPRIVAKEFIDTVETGGFATDRMWELFSKWDYRTSYWFIRELDSLPGDFRSMREDEVLEMIRGWWDEDQHDPEYLAKRRINDDRFQELMKEVKELGEKDQNFLSNIRSRIVDNDSGELMDGELVKEILALSAEYRGESGAKTEANSKS